MSSYLYYKDTLHNRTFSVRDTNDNFWNLYKNFIPFRLNYIDFIKTEKKGMHYEVIIKNTTENGENETSNYLNIISDNKETKDHNTTMKYYKYQRMNLQPTQYNKIKKKEELLKLKQNFDKEYNEKQKEAQERYERILEKSGIKNR